MNYVKYSNFYIYCARYNFSLSLLPSLNFWQLCDNSQRKIKARNNIYTDKTIFIHYTRILIIIFHSNTHCRMNSKFRNSKSSDPRNVARYNYILKNRQSTYTDRQIELHVKSVFTFLRFLLEIYNSQVGSIHPLFNNYIPSERCFIINCSPHLCYLVFL